jgi:hypothetical protein
MPPPPKNADGRSEYEEETIDWERESAKKGKKEELSRLSKVKKKLDPASCGDKQMRKSAVSAAQT